MATNLQQKILIIEDDPGISNFLKTTVSAASYAAIVTGNGETALQMISSHCPDCILLDLAGKSYAACVPGPRHRSL